MSRDAKSHFGLLSDDAKLTKLQCMILAPFNKPFFVRACKDFSLVYPCLICQSWV